jgi:hypothetical protein
MSDWIVQKEQGQGCHVVLEVHRHGGTRPVYFSNVNDLLYATGESGDDFRHCHFDAIDWTHSITRPFQTIRISMRFTGGYDDDPWRTPFPTGPDHFNGMQVPATRDWIVLKIYRKHDQKEVLEQIAWGRVHRTSGTHSVRPSSGFVDKTSYTIEAESFLDFLGRCNVVAALGIEKNVGTLYDRVEWKEIAVDVAQVMFDKQDESENPQNIVGTRLAKVFRAVGKQRLPGTLGGGYLGDVVKVVFNQARARQYATKGPDEETFNFNERTVESVPGFRSRGLESMDPMEGSALDLLLGGFLADPGLIECFPSMEVARNRKKQTKLGKTLASNEDAPFNPVLIYRMKPWRAESVGRFAARNTNHVTNVAQRQPPDWWDIIRAKTGAVLTTPTKEASEFTAMFVEQAKKNAMGFPISKVDLINAYETVRADWINPGKEIVNQMFPGSTWPESPQCISDEMKYRIATSDIYSMTYSMDDSKHVNCVTARGYRQATTQIDFSYTFMGLPFTAELPIVEEGLRFYRPDWPFWFIDFGDSGDAEQVVDQRAYVRTVAAVALMFTGNASRFFGGTLVIGFRPELKAGTCFIAGDSPAQVQAAGGRSGLLKQAQAPKGPAPNLEMLPPGGGFPGGQLQGYIESVSHRLSLGENNVVHGETHIQYSRGLANEDTPLTPRQKGIPGSALRNTWHMRYNIFQTMGGIAHAAEWEAAFDRIAEKFPDIDFTEEE